MGGMRFSKKRKIAGLIMKPVTLKITQEAREKLDKIAGPESLAATVEELVVREYRRRERKLSQQVHDLSC
jgi:hypothetical protein